MSELQKIEAARSDKDDDSDIELIDLLIIWAKRKKFIAGFTLSSTVCAVLLSLLMPNVYESTIQILPPQQQQSNAAAILSQVGGIANGMAASITKNPNDIYVAMIKSRTIADVMVDRFALLSVYGTKLRVQARKKLEGNTRVLNGKDGIISIDVADADPKRASLMANAYGEELLKMTRSLAVTQAAQARLFYESQLKIAKDKLALEEEKLRTHLPANGVISVDNESMTLMAMAARLRAQVAGKEIQIAAMKAFVTENNAEYKRNLQELLSTKEELSKLENGQSASKTASVNSPANEGLSSMHLLRDVKYYQMLYEILSKQYESARLDEARDAAIIQVLDEAIVPETKIAPRRTLIVLISAIAAFLLSLLFTLFFEYAQRLKGQSATQNKVNLLRKYMMGSRH